MEQEITVLINTSYEELDKILKEKDFTIKEEYIVDDTYMIDKNIDISRLNNLEVLSKCILVREIPNCLKQLVYKDKKYDEFGNILEQRKIKCPIDSTEDAVKFMEAINYKILFNIYDKCIVYTNNKVELVVQLVDDHIYIELEDLNEEFKSIEELKNMLDSYDLPYEKNNYFVKKAEIKLKEKVR